MDEARGGRPVSQRGGMPPDVPIPEAICIRRTALFARIDELRASSEFGASIWLAARAGAGKTTLARSYAEARDLPLISYCLSPTVADPARFLEDFARALACGVPGAAIASSGAVDEASVRRLVEAASSRLGRPAIVLFDDVHTLPPDAFAVTAIRHAIDAAPSNVTIMVGSRRQPPPGFSRSCVSGRLAVIGDAEMLFDPGEAEALLRLAGVKAPGEIARIRSLADGWAAGLALMVRRARSTDPVPEIAFDYLTDEVLNAMPPECRFLLVRTAMLPFVPEAVAVELTGDPRAPVRLRALARDSGFVRVIAGTPTTYEVHPLLRATLRARFAEDEAQSQVLRPLHVSAARLLAESGQVDSAITLLSDAGDWAGVMALVQRHAPDLVADGRLDMLRGWLRAVSAASACNDPWVPLWAGVCVRESDPAVALWEFEQAWRGFQSGRPEEGALLACCGALGALASVRAGSGAVDLWLDRLEVHLPQVADAVLPPATEILLHEALRLLLRCRPSHGLLPSLARRALRVTEASGHPAACLAAACFARRQLLLEGDVREQARLRVLDAESASAPGAPTGLRMEWLELEALHLCELLDFTGARGATEHLRKLVQETGPGPWVTELAWCSACIAVGTGDLLLAEAAVAEVDRSRNVTDAWHRHRAAAIRAAAALLRRDAEAARTHLEAEIDVIGDVRAPAAEVEFLQLAAVTLAKCSASNAAVACLAKAERIAAAAGLGALRRSGCFVSAYVALATDDASGAESALRTGIGLAREQGCPNWGLALTPAIVARLAGAALAAGIEPGWVREIIRTRHLMPEGPPSAAWPWPVRIHSLGRFTVLRRDEEVRFVGRSQRKPMELLETLLALGGREVSAARVAGALWPQSDGDSAANTLGTTLHRLRKLLGEDATITLVDGRLTLDPRLVWVDTWAFERSVSECETLLAAGASPAAILKSFDGVLSRYRGPFLPANEGGPGVLARRERLHGRFQRISEAVAEIAIARCASAVADTLCHRILDIDPLAEPIHRALMRSLAAQGRHGEALEICARAERMLQAELGRGVSPATRALRRSISDAASSPDS